jgi:predicted nucleotidyltransferase
MPSVSPPSAGATYLNKAERIDELRAAARRAAQRLPAIRRVVLFGSLVSGIPTAHSDADLLVVLETSPHDRSRDRIPSMLQALRPLPCPVDLFIFTDKELQQLSKAGAPVVRLALETGRDLLEL